MPSDSDKTAFFIGWRGEPLRLNGVQAILGKVKRESDLEDREVASYLPSHLREVLLELQSPINMSLPSR